MYGRWLLLLIRSLRTAWQQPTHALTPYFSNKGFSFSTNKGVGPCPATDHTEKTVTNVYMSSILSWECTFIYSFEKPEQHWFNIVYNQETIKCEIPYIAMDNADLRSFFNCWISSRIWLFTSRTKWSSYINGSLFTRLNLLCRVKWVHVWHNAPTVKQISHQEH